MPLTDIIIWLSAGLLLLAVAIVGILAVLANRLPSHDEDLDQLLAEMARPKKGRP
jgi:hypothetical protein